MPNTLTGFTTFVPNTLIESSKVNENFNNFRGTSLPVDPTTTAAADDSYDLGTEEYRWRRLHLSLGVEFGNVYSAAPYNVSATGDYFIYNRSGNLYLREIGGVERQLGSAPMVMQTSLSYSDLKSSDTTTVQGNLLHLQPGSVVCGYAFNESVVFQTGGTTITSLALKIGTSDDTVTRYLNDSIGLTSTALLSYHAADFDVRAYFTTVTVQYEVVGDQKLTNLTATGTVDIYFMIGRFRS